jgi:hypothetical protein
VTREGKHTDTAGSTRNSAPRITLSNSIRRLTDSTLNTLGRTTYSIVRVIHSSSGSSTHIVCDMLDRFSNTTRKFIKTLASVPGYAIDRRVHPRSRRVRDLVQGSSGCANRLIQCTGRGVDTLSDDAGLLLRC